MATIAREFFNIVGPATVQHLHSGGKNKEGKDVDVYTIVGNLSAKGYEVILEVNTHDWSHIYCKTVYRKVPYDLSELLCEKAAGRSLVTLKHVPGERVEQILTYYGDVLVVHAAYPYKLDDAFLNTPLLMGTVDEEGKDIIGIPMEYTPENVCEGYTSIVPTNEELRSKYQKKFDDLLAKMAVLASNGSPK